MELQLARDKLLEWMRKHKCSLNALSNITMIPRSTLVDFVTGKNNSISLVTKYFLGLATEIPEFILKESERAEWERLCNNRHSNLRDRTRVVFAFKSNFLERNIIPTGLNALNYRGYRGTKPEAIVHKIIQLNASSDDVNGLMSSLLLEFKKAIASGDVQSFVQQHGKGVADVLHYCNALLSGDPGKYFPSHNIQNLITDGSK